MSTEYTTTDAVDTYAVVAYLRTGGSIDTHAVELYVSISDDPDNPIPEGAPIDTDTPPPGLELPRTTLGDWDADHAGTMAAALAGWNGLELGRPATVSGDFAPGALAMIWLATRPELAPDTETPTPDPRDAIQKMHDAYRSAYHAEQAALVRVSRLYDTPEQGDAVAVRDAAYYVRRDAEQAVMERADTLLADFAAWLIDTMADRFANLSAPTDAGPHQWRRMLTRSDRRDRAAAAEQLEHYLQTRTDTVPDDSRVIIRHARARYAIRPLGSLEQEVTGW